MNKIPFWKLTACGNDYIYIDKRNAHDNVVRLIPAMCDRHFGIGGDGVVLVDFDHPAMEMYNADGSRGTMCGNALRSVGHLLYSMGGLTKAMVRTDCGTREVLRCEDGQYRAEMGAVRIVDTMEIDNRTIYVVDVGNLHAVCLDNTVQAHHLAEALKRILPKALDGINVEVVDLSQEVSATVYERGTGYTLSCGSGACAVATVLWALGYNDNPIHIHMRGGVLTVTQRDGLWLTGAVRTVAEGVYYVE